MAETMEGFLPWKNSMKPSLNTNGNSSQGIDRFTVKYLRTFWPQHKNITKDALNTIQKDGLSQTLGSAIPKLLRKGEKNPLEIGNYRPTCLLSIFYKLASYYITLRIKPAVEALICATTKGLDR